MPMVAAAGRLGADPATPPRADSGGGWGASGTHQVTGRVGRSPPHGPPVAWATPLPLKARMLALISLVLSLFVLVLFVRGILSWIPEKRGALRTVDDIVFRLTEPVLAPVRRVIPPMGGIDVSFIVVIVAIWIFRALVLH